LSKLIERLQTEFQVLEYSLPKIDLSITDIAIGAGEDERRSAGFRLSEIIRAKTGLKNREIQAHEDNIEDRTLQKLKEVKEAAYAEAFELGKREGKTEAYQNYSSEIDRRLKGFDQLIAAVEEIKLSLLAQNESHLIQLMFEMAKRLAAQEISVDPHSTLQIIQQAVSLAQSEEEIIIKVAPQHLEFIESLRLETKREFEFIKRAKIEADAEVGIGGCIVTTNYGEIDSRFDQRVSRLWESMQDTLVKIKATVVKTAS
jgi:flagellar assembly protein FliH